MAIKLFDLIDAVWDDEKWSQITTSEKQSHFFMMNRILSIVFIQEAQMLNKAQINYAQVVDFWREVLKQRFQRKPSFMFTKTKKLEKKDSSVQKNFSKDVIVFYKTQNELDDRDFETLCTLFPKEMQAELKIYEKNL